MEKIEEFYFGDGDDCGEKMFKRFADEHYKYFTDYDPTNEGQEHKLE